MPELSWFHYLLAWVGAFSAGVIDSMAGGGGLIILPLLLAMGIPPHIALGTNKLQGSFGTLTASLRYRKSGLVSFRSMLPAVLFTFIGALTGAALTRLISSEILAWIVPFLLTAIFLFTLFSPKLGENEGTRRMGENLFYLMAGLILGFYDGFFGPGTGAFWTIGFILLLGWNFKRATGATKVVNFTSNLAALIFFLIAGQVHLKLGLSMALFQIAGAITGSRLVIKGSVKLIKRIFLTVVALTLAKLFWDLLISG